jgi:[acyl-carrier-protein] S-malonyltransferase
MKIVFMFSGQGSQYLGMGKDLYELYDSVKKIFHQAEAITKYPIRKIMFEDELLLNNPLYTQVCMFTLYQAILTLLNEKEISADYSFGLSLGEYGAYLHNNVFDFARGIEIIKQRSICMNDATKNSKGIMSAIIGLNAETLDEIIKDIDGYIKIANYNTYQQLVVSGSESSVLHLNQVALERGAKRAILLNVGGAYHSNLMQEAANSFRRYLQDVVLKEPSKKLFINATGKLYEKDIKENLVNHLTESVRFYQIVEQAIDLGINTYIEIGPKRTLSSFVKKIKPQVNILNIEDCKTLETTILKLEEMDE